MKTTAEALRELADQYGRRTEVHKQLRRFKGNWLDLNTPYKSVLDTDTLTKVARAALERRKAR